MSSHLVTFVIRYHLLKGQALIRCVHKMRESGGIKFLFSSISDNSLLACSIPSMNQEVKRDERPMRNPKRVKPSYIGVVHLPALPGDPRSNDRSYSPVYEHALNDARALIEGGVEGIMIENFGSAPFQKGTRQDPAPPHQVAALAVVAHEIKALAPEMKLGINCLRNDAIAALGVAAAVGADLIRVNVLSGAYVTDQGLIEGEAAATLRYRRQLNADHIKIFADVLVKHASPLAPLEIEQAALDTWRRGGADALIVSGTGTGAAVSAEFLKRAQEAVDYRCPVYIGSGLSLSNVSTLAPLASGAIVGTALKHEGQLDAPVCASRTRALGEVLASHW